MNLVERLRESMRGSDICHEAADRIEALEKELAHWKNNHETEVRRARVLKERPDLPIERVEAYVQWGKDQKRIEQLELELELSLSEPELRCGIALQLNEIERLREDNKRLVGENDRVKQMFGASSYALELEKQLASAQAELEGERAAALNYRDEAISAQAENLKLREALDIAHAHADSLGDSPEEMNIVNDARLSTTSDTTALTEYRNGVIEECAVLLDKMDSQYFDGYEFRHVLPADWAEDLRAMKEKP